MDKLFTLNSAGFDSVNAAYIEALHEDYLADPNSVTTYWQEIFQQLESSRRPPVVAKLTHSGIKKALREQARRNISDDISSIGIANHKQVGVIRLISAYRYLGHRQADIDPLATTPPLISKNLIRSFMTWAMKTWIPSLKQVQLMVSSKLR